MISNEAVVLMDNEHCKEMYERIVCLKNEMCLNAIEINEVKNVEQKKMEKKKVTKMKEIEEKKKDAATKKENENKKKKENDDNKKKQEKGKILDKLKPIETKEMSLKNLKCSGKQIKKLVKT